MAARVIVYKSRMTKTMRRTKILCPPLFYFLKKMINPNPSPIGTTRFGLLSFGTPDRSRTCDLQNRNLLLYPTELREHNCILYGFAGFVHKKCGVNEVKFEKRTNSAEDNRHMCGKYSAADEHYKGIEHYAGGNRFVNAGWRASSAFTADDEYVAVLKSQLFGDEDGVVGPSAVYGATLRVDKRGLYAVPQHDEFVALLEDGAACGGIGVDGVGGDVTFAGIGQKGRGARLVVGGVGNTVAERVVFDVGKIVVVGHRYMRDGGDMKLPRALGDELIRAQSEATVQY